MVSKENSSLIVGEAVKEEKKTQDPLEELEVTPSRSSIIGNPHLIDSFLHRTHIILVRNS